MITVITKREEFDQQVYSQTDDVEIDAKIQLACDVNEVH